MNESSIAEQLYCRVYALHPKDAGKITDLLLATEDSDIIQELFGCPKLFAKKVNEIFEGITKPKPDSKHQRVTLIGGIYSDDEEITKPKTKIKRKKLKSGRSG